MSQKPAFSFNSLKSSDSSNAISSPFWVKPKSKTSKTKEIFKQIFKWTKVLLLLFFFVMGLWGCFQSSFDPLVASSTTIGSGLEFGFVFGTTGDFNYDLSSTPLNQFHTFSKWTMAYGPFYALFVYPGAWLTMKICWATHGAWGGLNALLAIFILILIIRGLTIAITIKSTMQNEKMTEVNGKVSEINAKYKGLKDTASKQMKQQEIMDLYRKNDVHPFAAFEQLLITLPIFLIIYRVVTILRPLKTTVLFNIWNFSHVPLTQIFNNFLNGGWTYIFLVIILVGSQFLSAWLPQHWAKLRNRNATTDSSKGAKENKKRLLLQYGFTGVMSLIVIFTATGVGIYWFFNAMLAILQSYIMHRIIISHRKRNFKHKFESLTIA